MNKLTLGTLNLNSQKLNAKKFADIVLESNIDIICFNECGKSLAERLQSLLAPYGFSHVFAPADYCGNALFSRFPIKRHHTLKLFASQSEGRSAVAITVDLPLHDIEETGVSHQEVSLVATHLCHYDEDARIEQFDILRRKVPEIENGTCFILGDFNSLCQSDYSDEEWNDISRVRERSCWEEPKSALMNHLLNDLKYRDSLRNAHNASSSPVPSPPSTCRFGTRIDWILLPVESAMCERGLSVSCLSVEKGGYSVVDTSHITDHNLVVSVVQINQLR